MPRAAAVLPPLPLALAGMAACAVAATTAPLLTYSLTLATLGGAHVLSELRYVEARFTARLSGRLLAGLGALLALVALLRLARALDLSVPGDATAVELVVVLGLAGLALPTLARAGVGRLALGLAVVGAVGVGLLASPIWTILVLACLHNWTPVGFLAEGLPAPERRRGAGLVALAFGAGPVLVFLASSLGAGLWPQATWLPTGGLQRHLGAYLPTAVHDAGWAVPLFSALAYAQCMHYAAVLGVLPRIAPGGPAAPAAVGLSRIPGRAWLAAVVLLSAAGLLGFVEDFGQARAWYGIAAAVHAWVEVPVLLVALAPRGLDSTATTAA